MTLFFSVIFGLLGACNLQTDATASQSKNNRLVLEDDTLRIDSSQWLVAYAINWGRELAPRYSQADCTRFMELLLNEFIDFSSSDLDGLYIRKVPISQIRTAVKQGNRSGAAAGLVGVLVKKGLADPVSPEDLQSGDIIQYWYSYELTPIDQTPRSRIFGHVGLISSPKVVNHGVYVMSSSRSDDGFSNKYFQIDWPYQLYACRLKKQYQ